MNGDQLLAHFDTIVEGSDAISRIRRFILDLAVRGRLVPQDRRDKSMPELLMGAEKENRKLEKQRTKRQRNLAPSPNDEAPFSIPDNWIWTDLGSIGDWGSGCTPSRGNPDFFGGGITWLKSGELNDNRHLVGSEETLTKVALEQGSFRTNFPGDVLIAMYGATIGKAAILAEKAVTNQAVCGCTPIPAVFNEFLFLFLVSQRDQFRATSEGGAQPNISKVKIQRTRFPLPPLAEQRRIVAKVDELMTLCDQLELAESSREVMRETLSAASLARLNAPDDDTFRDDVRFALDTLSALTARPNQLKQFRQTIFNLAVRGKLVPPSSGVQDTEQPDWSAPEKAMALQLPSHWRCARLADILAEDTRNGYSRKPDDAPEGRPILRISAGTARRDGIVAEEEHKLISGIDAKLFRQYELKEGDLLACRFNGNKAYVGRLTLFKNYLDIQPIYPDKLIRVRVSSQLAIPAFIRIAAEADLIRNQIETACATTVGNWGISASNLKEVFFPIPPLCEQISIVATVEELIALCDKLEDILKAGKDIRGRLLEALTREMSSEPAEQIDLGLEGLAARA